MPWWPSYKRRKLRKVKGGIKAQSKRGKFGESWWAERWNQTLQDYDLGARLGRGRSYARSGQVGSINIKKGLVTSIVHGSEVYNVSIQIDVLDTEQWESVTKEIFSRPDISAPLLAGQLPKEIESVFTSLELGIFPDHDEIKTDCTCPDWSNPCKHIAAVYLLLAEEFDRDPFLIFKLRGMERKKLLKTAGMGMRKKKEEIESQVNSTDSSKTDTPPTSTKKTRQQRSRRLSSDPEKFWGRLGDYPTTTNLGSGQSNNTTDGKATTDNKAPDSAMIPTIPAVHVRQLGSFPFWRGEEQFIPSMEKIYSDASEKSTRIFLGEDTDEDTDKDDVSV